MGFTGVANRRAFDERLEVEWNFGRKKLFATIVDYVRYRFFSKHITIRMDIKVGTAV